MTRIDIMKKLNKVFREVFDDDTLKITEKTTAKDVEGWDSLIHITLIGEIEDAFRVKFTMKEVTGMKNVGEMAAIIEARAK
ncbi:MAG: acyl carrier protein [Clostridia bacterium]|nr:acyl carrier protein [Clostridia bacterium]MBQ9408240.1 acyl carrier protein [Clostridia bacterium]